MKECLKIAFERKEERIGTRAVFHNGKCRRGLEQLPRWKGPGSSKEQEKIKQKEVENFLARQFFFRGR